MLVLQRENWNSILKMESVFDYGFDFRVSSILKMLHFMLKKLTEKGLL